VAAVPDARIDRLRSAAARVAESCGLEIFDVQFRREPIGWVLRVVLDRPWTPDATSDEPVSIDDCKRVSQDLNTLLDVEEDLTAGIDRRYTLEVSSPGLDRKLRGEMDYRRFVGRVAKIVTREPVSGQSHFAGRLAGVEDGTVLLVEGRRTHRVPFALIDRARLEVEFGV
jgi:ribosome maturation factor RimP